MRTLTDPKRCKTGILSPKQRNATIALSAMKVNPSVLPFDLVGASSFRSFIAERVGYYKPKSTFEQSKSGGRRFRFAMKIVEQPVEGQPVGVVIIPIAKMCKQLDLLSARA
jgi:hypothetical protein